MASNGSNKIKGVSPTHLVASSAIAILILLVLSLLKDWLINKLDETSVSNKMLQFNIPEYKMRFLYPENWSAFLTPQGNHGDLEVIAVFAAKGLRYRNLAVASKQIESGEVSEIADWGISRIEARFARYNSWSLVSYSSDEVSGLVREYIAYTNSPLETENIHCKDLYLLHEQDGFVFAFCADESDWIIMSLVFEKIIESIQFLE